MPGIINQTLYTTNFGSLTTAELRDDLLNRNLPPPVSNTVTEAGVSSYFNDIGKIINVPIGGVPNENIPVHYDEDEKLFPLGEFFRNTKNVNNNIFKPLNDDYGTIGFSDYISPTTPIPNWVQPKDPGPYPTQYNSDNFDLVNKGDKKGVINPYNIINFYQNLNLNKESSLALVGGEELQIGITNKIAQVETTKVNSITTGLNSVDEYTNRIKQNQSFFNTLPNDAVGWQEYNSNNKDNLIAAEMQKVNVDLGSNVNPSLSTEARVNSLLSTTGIEQVEYLFTSFQQNLYVPKYTDSRFEGTSLAGTNSRYYIGSERTTNRGATITQKFQSSEFNGDDGENTSGVVKATTVDEEFFWKTGDQTNFNENTLLYKTQRLLDEHPDGVWINQTKKYFKDRTTDKLISRGNAISAFSLLEAEANGNYCRVWTVNDNYTYANAIRNSGLFSSPDVTLPGFSVTEGKSSLSVLMKNGIPKYHPTKEDSTTTFKKFMLSLENLAWADNLADLPLQEIGPGDLLSGNKGRIMWFPPYDLRFDENTSANWSKTDFIGRGEPVYTYNNSSRSGQLSFKILVDHPQVINGYRGKRVDAIERFMAGCLTPEEFLGFLDKNAGISPSQKAEIDKKLQTLKSEKQNAESNQQQKSWTLVYGTEKNTDATPSSSYNQIVQYVVDLVEQGNSVTIEIEGFRGSGESKGKSLKRITNTRKLINDELKVIDIPKSKYNFKTKDNKDSLSTGVTTGKDAPESDRRVEVTVSNDALADAQAKLQEGLGDIAFYPEEAQIIDSLIIDEGAYFDFIDNNYPNYFQTISEKIKYFQPGFHSTTPEGLNSRLTFLNQCMRQGPSIYDDRGTVQPQNLAFGRPPICILRIGDFFHTKVAINSLNITYEAGSGIQWDLNPSGIGVQPMMANITLSLDIIGGMSLVNPINRLQNAMSFNFYANTEMYDVRSDTVSKSSGKIVDGLKLSKMKKDALGKDGLLKLTDSLKTEGIINQSADSNKTGNQTGVEGNGNITINAASTGLTLKVNNTSDLEKDVKVVISMQTSMGENADFEEIVNATNLIKPDESQEFDLSSKASSFTKKDEKIEEIDEKIEVCDNLITGLNQEINNIISGATSGSVSKKMKKRNKQEEKKADLEKKKADLQNRPNQIKVNAFFTKEKEGSNTNKTFTYKDSKLS